MQWFRLAVCMIVFRHTVGLLWTSDQPVSETSTCTGQHNLETQETNIHALSGIRTGDLATKRPQTYALDRAATEVGINNPYPQLNNAQVFLLCKQPN
jgi:hypothetical protein